MQKVASEYLQWFLRYRPKFFTHIDRRKIFYCIFGIRNTQNGYFRLEKFMLEKQIS
ncbi:hypothetical protein O3M35_000302 [Rhynocoris fuscipes]|uniref:Maturase K n=1 Tax=Rhynocoris fuscipes TaxID=488301 RepID=A0AAW1DKX9_9HEMI